MKPIKNYPLKNKLLALLGLPLILLLYILMVTWGSVQELQTLQVIKIVIIPTILLVILYYLIFIKIKFITDQIKYLNRVANRIAKGEVNFQVDTESNDEIGSLASTFNFLISNIKQKATIADAIGKGNYSGNILPISEYDLLGIALNSMKQNLDKVSKENERKNWLLTASNLLNETMRGEKNIGDLSSDVLSALSIFFEAQIGWVYIFDQQQNLLYLKGSYAADINPKPILKIGEGMVGRVASEKRLLLLDRQADHNENEPTHSIVFPILYDLELKGVVEIRTIKPITPLQLELLELVSEDIGIAFHSTQASTKLKELLGHTQFQAEELEQVNEELQRQKHYLQISEEELIQTNGKLIEKAQQLEEQNESITRKNIQLEEAREALRIKAEELELANKYKSEFLANMSHELRTPLNSVLILAKLLADNEEGNLSKKQQEFANVIYNSGDELLALINDILDLAKIESGKLELIHATFSIYELKDSIYNIFKEVARTKGIEFKVSLGESVPDTIYTDRLRLGQILKNLLSNAFKFTHHGGYVQFKIFVVENEQLKLPMLQHFSKAIAFEVTDDGIGIEDDKQEQIFKAFQQADGSTSRNYGGTGLGLSICRELSMMLQGEITLKSKFNLGSTFTFYLPIMEPTPMQTVSNKNLRSRSKLSEIQKALSSDQELPTKLEKKILIIDNDIRNIYSLHGALAQKQVQIFTAATGDEAIAVLMKNQPFNLILIDVMTPALDGKKIIRLIRSHVQYESIPIIALAAEPNDGNKKSCLELGASEFIAKPIRLDKVLSLVDHWI